MKTHAIILAGGKGSRLKGKDKGLELFNGKRLIDWTIAAIIDSVDTICISCNRNNEDYGELGFPVYADNPDPNSFLGPVSGIISCSREIDSGEGDLILVVPCDTPNLDKRFAKQLFADLKTNSVSVASDGDRIHNLHLLMRSELLASLESYFEQGGRSIKGWLSDQPVSVSDFSDTPNQFKNFNQLSDFDV